MKNNLEESVDGRNRSFPVMAASEVLPNKASTIPNTPATSIFDFCRPLASRPGVQLAILILAMLLITCKDISIGDFRNPDAWSHAMNGVYLLDLLKRMPVDHFWDYTVSYYAKYPAISLPYHPPGFPLVEMIFFAVFGISPATARFAVACCGIFGMIAWYSLARSTHGKAIAFLSSLMIFANPTMVSLSRQVMLEIPTLAMTVLSIYCLHRAIESSSRSYLYWWALSAGASVWFKQSALFVLPLSLTYFLLKRRKCTLRCKDLLFSLMIVVIAFVPILLTTWYFARSAVDQVFVSTKNYGVMKSSIHYWFYYLRSFSHLVSVPFLIAASISLALLVWKKHWKRYLIYLLWLAWSYALISYISVKELRYAVFLVPPLCLLACSIMDEIQIKIKGINVATALLSCACLVQCVYAYRTKTPVLVGFEQAARYVVENWKGDTVIVCARYHGNFTFNVRRFDPAGRVMVLRAEKVIPQLLFKSEKWKEEYLYDALRSLGTRYIVVDNLNWEDIPELTRLRSYLKDPKFVLRKRIDFTGNMKSYQGRSILIYEFLGKLDPLRKSIDMRMPKMRRKLGIPLKPYNEPLQ